MVEHLLSGLSTLLEPSNFVFMFLGLTVGIIFGALPGLTATLGVVVMLSFTFAMEATTGMFLLLGVYFGGIYGGAISAILINTPGTDSSAATLLDGHPLAQQGRAREALHMAVFATLFGGTFSALMLLVIAPQLAKVALAFGPAEFFALAVFALAMVSSVSSGTILKGLIMAVLGLFLATVGFDPVGGIPRLTFGIAELQSGIQIIPALVGLFGIAEIIRRVSTAHLPISRAAEDPTQNTWRLPPLRVRRYLRTLLKSSAIGTFVGAIPGTGPTPATFLSYNEARRSSSNKNNFGKGELEGVAAAEAGNNSACPAALIPLLTLGIPGDTTTAVLLGALALQGLTPGPQLFTEQAGIVYAIMLGVIVLQLMLYIQGRLASRLFAKVANVPMNVLIPVLLVITTVGAYSINNTVFNVKVMMLLGLVGYIMSKLHFPIVPMLLGLILGPIAEEGFRQALLQSGGDWTIFFARPISLSLIIIAVIAFFIPILAPYISKVIQTRRGSASGEAE